MGAIASQITSLTIVYSTVYPDADQRKHQSSASLAFMRGIHRGPVNSPHKWPVTRKMFPFDDVIMGIHALMISSGLIPFNAYFFIHDKSWLHPMIYIIGIPSSATQIQLQLFSGGLLQLLISSFSCAWEIPMKLHGSVQQYLKSYWYRSPEYLYILTQGLKYWFFLVIHRRSF